MMINEAKAEITGIYIGNGHISKVNNKYQVGFTGNPKTDVELFERIQLLIKQEWNKEVKFKVRERGLRMLFRCKEVSDFLVNELRLPYGKGKCWKVKIPEVIEQDWDLAKYVIRGVMDTDGSVFVSKKPRIEKYPTMEITTTSKELANQIRDLLLRRDFTVGKIRESSRSNYLTRYVVALYGKNNLRMWIKEVGFSNQYKLNRALEYSR